MFPEIFFGVLKDEVCKVDYREFLKADILCLLHDYGEMSAEGINSILGTDDEKVEDALLELVLEKKVMEVGENKYVTIDEINVKRLKKNSPSTF